ncbi:MAG: DUF2384 domain-containing protein [Actinobacteria bacterium]|nr:DUF2384 domain-containing protein [Actinomycetota bacterium]
MPALLQRYQDASEETRRQVDRLLAQDADDRAWAEQLGPVYRQRDVADLLGKSKQAVSADQGLLKLELRSGQVGYPVFQFDGRRVLPGVREVVETLTPSVATSWTIASWLSSPQPSWDGARPLDQLRAGRIEEVLAASRRVARTLAA